MSDTETYDHAYRPTMERIKQCDDKGALAKDTLAWITRAKATFMASTLRKTLGVRADKSEFDDDDCSDVEDMVSVCAGLVTVDKGSGIIRVVHYTAQEYLEWTR